MDVKFNFQDPQDGASTKVYFEQVFAEKPGGGLVANPDFDIEPSTAVGVGNNGLLYPIKGYRLVDAVVSEDTTIKIAKGSGIAVGDIIATGKKGVAATAVDTSNAGYDLVTVTLGVAVANGTVLYQALSASASSAKPKYDPVYVTGAWVKAGKGDQRVRLINGANLRKATANIAPEVAALMKSIDFV